VLFRSGTDNRGSKYLLNDACVLLGKPLVFGAISEFEGQVAVFNAPVPDGDRVNYRDIFPLASAGADNSCRITGVLGVLPGIIGCMQCNEAIKLITGLGRPLTNKMLIYNALTCKMNEFTVSANPGTRLLIPADRNEFMLTRYEVQDEPAADSLELSAPDFQQFINRENTTVIDVREYGRRISPVDFQYIHIPYSELCEKLSVISGDTVITFCEMGILSLQAAKLLRNAFGVEKQVYSLYQGIQHWNLTRKNA
jgi:rhodanese-related sulfurtransferase